MSSNSRTSIVGGASRMITYASSDDSDDEEEIQLESRLAVKYVHAVLSSMSEYKKFLVEGMGFSGMLKLPDIKKLNLKFSYWLMMRVDTTNRCINISQDRTIPFWDVDFGKVFGVPCGRRELDGPDGSVTAASIEFIKKTIGMTGPDSHSLKPAELFIQRDLTEDSSGAEKECFRASVVIFLWGHILCPSGKHDYTNIDFGELFVDQTL